jgi:hypothetical protein
MAGNWIKMRHDLQDAPEVRRIARAAGIDRDQVVGKLYRFWTWADRHGKNGEVDADLEDVDEQVGLVGFGAALVSVGWLDSQAGGIVIPNWDRHFSDSAKVRALGQNRAEKHRNAASVTSRPSPRNAPSVTGPRDGVTQGALPDKRRGEEKFPPSPREATPPDPEQAAATIRAAWASAVRSGRGKPYGASGMPKGWPERLAEPGWLDEALEAIQRLPSCRFFEHPVTLHQLCLDGFVGKVLAGQYDDPKAAASRPSGRADERRPASEAAAEWQRKAADPDAARRTQEYVEAKARKARARSDQAAGRVDGDFEAARAAVLESLRAEGAA